MASNIDYPPYITAGLISKRFYLAASRTAILKNLIRILQENQDAQLAAQSTLDGWSPALGSIPTNHFHIGAGKDFNALACHVVPVTKRKISEGQREDTMAVSVIVTLEQGDDPYAAFARADSYLTAFDGIIETFLLKAPSEFLFGLPQSRNGGPFCGITGEVRALDLANTSAFVQGRTLGWLPTLELQFSIFPTRNS